MNPVKGLILSMFVSVNILDWEVYHWDGEPRGESGGSVSVYRNNDSIPGTQ